MHRRIDSSTGRGAPARPAQPGGAGTLGRAWRRLVVVVAATALSLPLVAAGPATAAPADPVEITVRGSDVVAAAQNVNGLTFKGFGVLSANSTSSLLLDYKAQQPEKYWELIEVLFGGPNPIMNTVKIEMGNDRNTSTGPNAATMRTRDEYPNVQREPGFQLAADAQKVAEGDVHLSLLRWARPTWVASHEDQYVWFKNTALAAYREYGIMVDSINPDSNETHNPDQQLYKDFSAWVRTDDKGYEGASQDDPNNGFASEEEQEFFRSVQTVAGDTVGTPPVEFGNAMTSSSDSSLRDAVDVVGFHYSSADDSAGNLKRLAEEFDKEIWNAEGQATFSSSADRPHNTNSDEQGGTGTQFGGTNSALEMGNWITTGFSMSRRTQTIYQPAIGSFYDGFQYSSKELVSARDPWSGWIYYDGGLAVLQHFTQFAELGWENADNTAGIWRGIPQASASGLGGGNPPSGARAGNHSYTTLAAPDASDFSTVIINDSAFTKTYRIAAQDLDLGDDTTMEVWETRAADDGQAYDAAYVVPVAEITPDSGVYTVTVKPWSAVTATTLDHARVGSDGALTAREGYGNLLPTSPEHADADGGRDVLDTDASGKVNGVTDDEFLYADDFDYADLGTVRTYDPASGSLVDTDETLLDSRGGAAKPDGTAVSDVQRGATPLYSNDTNGAFESVDTGDAERGRVLRQQVGAGMVGGAWNGGDPKTTIGDFRWANYEVSVDVLFEDGSGRYASVGARQQGGTSNGQNVSAAELRIDPAGAWSLQRYGATVASGRTADQPEVAFATGSDVWNTLAVRVAGNVYTALVNGVEVGSYADPAPQSTGRVQLGSGFTFTQFDNLEVRTVEGYTPYYTTVIDGMHQSSWADTSVPVLRFDQSWSHVNGQGMYEWQRTASNSTAQGATMTYTFTGTGLDIFGSNNGSARLDVVVDGVQVEAGAPTYAAGSSRTTFRLRGLADGEHTVEISTATVAGINVDGVGVITANAASDVVDTTAIEAALTERAGLDEDEYSQASWAAFSAVAEGATSAVVDPSAYGLDAEGAAALAARVAAAAERLVPRDLSDDVVDQGIVVVTTRTLPASLSFGGTDAAVTWDTDATDVVAALAELGSVEVTGRTTQRLGEVYQRFSATVLLTPADLTYFIDSGADSSAPGSVYAGVKAAFPQLRNDSADQQWDGSTAGAAWGYSTTSGTRDTGNAQDWGSSYLGADYTRPITYHLTLPAGTYEIVTLQAPRPGLATQIYSTVRAGSHENRATAQSTGAATPITQQVNLDAETVVDVEFGTNGTSGYNARLALVYVKAVPQDLGVQGALTVDAQLPGTVTIDGEATAVTWDEESAAQPRAEFEVLTITGSIGEGRSVVARYEIVPDGLVYYIDAGTDGADSPQYAAVRATVPGLANDKVDQVSTADDQWGHVAEGMRLKSGTDLGDKYSTGYYQDTTRLVYRLPLEAGTYTLSAGFTEWWGMNRTMNQSVSAGGEELAKGNVPLSGSNSPLTETLTFTLSEAATVEYLVTNEGAGGEKPVISWLAVASQLDRSALVAAVGAAQSLTQADYTAGSWARLAGALEQATVVLEDPDATAAEVAEATAALTGAQSELVSVVVLSAAVDLAETLVEDDYPTQSWEPFASALSAAREVLADADATTAGIDAVTVALLQAQLALDPESVVVDTTVLEAALRVADGLQEADHTAGSWQAFATARTAAHGVLDSGAATAEQVTAATTELLSTQAELVSVAALRAAVEVAQALVEDDYTPQTWVVFAQALTEASSTLADEQATAAQVGAALAGLTSAVEQLGEQVSTAVLAALVGSAERLAKAGYTVESWESFAAALAAAREVLADESATQSDVDAAARALIDARDGLIERVPEPAEVDRTALRAAVDSAEPLAEVDYTAQSWAPFAQALAQARALLDDASVTQDQVDAATTALITTQGALVAAQTPAPGDGDSTPDDGTDDVGAGPGTGATPDAQTPGLARTGAEVAVVLAVALALLLAGAGTITFRRFVRR